MSIISLVGNLLSSFSRRDIKNAVDTLKDDITDTKMVYQAADEFFYNWDWKSDPIKNFAKLWKANIRSINHGKENFVTALNNLVKQLSENVELLETLTDKMFQEEIMKDSMTYVQANILAYLETSGFAMRYANRLLRYVYVEETAAYDARETLTMSKYERKWIETNMLKFLDAFDAINVDRRELKDRINDIPDVTVDAEGTDGIAGAIGRKLDPLRMGFIGVKFNPIFYIRTAISEWQNDSNEERKLQRKTLEFRLMRLKNLAQDNVNDPKLKQQIEYYEEKLQSVTNKINKYEEDLRD